MFTVKKRTNAVVDYDVERIKRAIANADLDVATGDMSAADINYVIEFVENSLQFDAEGSVTVETIQDTIETALMNNGHSATAKAFILYRDHQKTRRILSKSNPVISDAVALIKSLSQGLRIDPSAIITSDIISISGKLDVKSLSEQVLLKTLDTIPLSTDYDLLAGRLVLMRAGLEASDELATHGLTYSIRNIVDLLVSSGLYDPNLFSPGADIYSKVSLDDHIAMIDPERDWNLNYLSAKTLVDRYMVKSRNGVALETPQMMFFRMAIAFSSQLTDLTFEEVYESLSTMRYFHSTPSMFNAGLVRPQMASCYLSTVGEDSLEGIFDMIKDNARLSKFAGGLGISITPVRAAGALIRGTNGISNGVIPWLKNVETMIVAVDQGGRRRGSACAYLDSWHADIWSFLQLKAEGGDEFLRTYALDTSNWIPDLLFQRAIARETWSLFSPDETPELIELKGNDFNEKYLEYEAKGEAGELAIFEQCLAYDLVKEMLSQLYETGGSWINFKDPSTMRYMGSKTKTVKSSNLCVTGDTLVLTRQGQVPIRELAGREVPAWNGKEWSMTKFARTNGSAGILRVVTSDHTQINPTALHEWSVVTLDGPIKKTTEELVIGDELIDFGLSPIESGTMELDDAYAVGFTCSTDPTTVPLGGYTHESKLGWLSGFFDADIERMGNYNFSIIQVQLTIGWLDVLQNVRLLLQELGVHSNIRRINVRDVAFYRLTVDSSSTKRLVESGLNTKLLNYAEADVRLLSDHRPIVITEIHPVDRIEETFCGTEPLRNLLMFNGVLTHQCTEILEVADAEETAVCTLGSIVLTNHLTEHGNGDYTIDWSLLATSIRRLIRALDTTIDYNYYPSNLAKTSNDRYRHLGAGVAGIGDLIATLKIPFDSEESVDLNHKIMEFISYHAILTSIDLAKEYGSFPMYEDSHWADGKVPLDLYREFNDYRNITEFDRFQQSSLDWDMVRARLKKHGIRNATLLAIAPTATSSNICMTSASNEPTYSNIYIKGNLSGSFTEVNRVLRRQLQEVGLWTPDMIDKIRDGEGSIQSISEIPQEIRRLHKTAFELDSMWTIKNAAARNPWIDQSQSLNFYIRNATGKKLFDNYVSAWEYGLKTTYYLRTTSAEEVNVEDEFAVMLPEVVFAEPVAEGTFCSMEEGCLTCQ